MNENKYGMVIKANASKQQQTLDTIDRLRRVPMDVKKRYISKVASPAILKRHKDMGERYYEDKIEKIYTSLFADFTMSGKIPAGIILSENNFGYIVDNYIAPSYQSAHSNAIHEVAEAFKAQYPYEWDKVNRDHHFNWGDAVNMGTFGSETHYSFSANDGYSIELAYDWSSKRITQVLL